MVGIFLCEVTTDGATFINDEAVIVLESTHVSNDHKVKRHVWATDDDRHLAEWVHRKKFGRFVFLGVHVDDDEFKWNLLLRESKCDNTPPPAGKDEA